MPGDSGTEKDEMEISVVEGDQATEHDSERIRATGCPALRHQRNRLGAA